jgi:hypothetical protein
MVREEGRFLLTSFMVTGDFDSGLKSGKIHCFPSLLSPSHHTFHEKNPSIGSVGNRFFVHFNDYR